MKSLVVFYQKSPNNKMPGVYAVVPAVVESRGPIGDVETRLNRLSSSRKSLVYKIGSTTQPFIEDRTRSYGEHHLVYECNTSRESALYIEEHLRNRLIALGYKQWAKKKDHFLIHHTDNDVFVAHIRSICNNRRKHLEKMENSISMGCDDEDDD